MNIFAKLPAAFHVVPPGVQEQLLWQQLPGLATNLNLFQASRKIGQGLVKFLSWSGASKTVCVLTL
jgi:hypothetical protein